MSPVLRIHSYELSLRGCGNGHAYRWLHDEDIVLSGWIAGSRDRCVSLACQQLADVILLDPRRQGRRGGAASAARLTKEQRLARSKRAIAARWECKRGSKT